MKLSTIVVSFALASFGWAAAPLDTAVPPVCRVPVGKFGAVRLIEQSDSVRGSGRRGAVMQVSFGTFHKSVRVKYWWEYCFKLILLQ